MIPIHAKLEMMGAPEALTALYRSSSTPRPFCIVSIASQSLVRVKRARATHLDQ